MSDASNALKDYLDTFKFSDAKTPIILNQTGNLTKVPIGVELRKHETMELRRAEGVPKRGSTI